LINYSLFFISKRIVEWGLLCLTFIKMNSIQSYYYNF